MQEQIIDTYSHYGRKTSITLIKNGNKAYTVQKIVQGRVVNHSQYNNEEAAYVKFEDLIHEDCLQD